MNKKTFLLSIIGIIAILVMIMGGTYNTLNNSRLEVQKQYANLDVSLQRRFDLIPNLVESTKGIINHEKEVFENLANARAKIGSATSTEEKLSANSELDGAISRLIAITENYPDLKANDNMRQLMASLEGTENRIAVSRNDYNEAVTNYNKVSSSFPTVLTAKLLGFKSEPFYKATEQAKDAPKVNF